MFLLREFIQSILLSEGRLEDVKKKYPDVDVDFLSERDPSGNNAYLDWMAKQSQNGEGDDKIVTTVAAFHRAKQSLEKRDINAYKNVAALRSALVSKSLPKVSGAELIAQNDEWYLLHIKTKRACVQLGAKDTNWCITQASQSHWENYTAQGAVFFFCIAKIPVQTEDAKLGDKYAISVIRNGNAPIHAQVWAPDDTMLSDQAARKIIGLELIEKAEEFTKSMPESMLSRIARGAVNVEELDRYLDTIDSPEKIQDMFSSVTHFGPTADILTWFDSRYAAVRECAVHALSKEEVSQFKDKLLSDPDIHVLKATIWRLPQNTPEFVKFAGTNDFGLFDVVMRHTHKKKAFISRAIELGNFDFINRFYTEIPVHYNEVAAMLLDHASEIDGRILARCATIIIYTISNENEEHDYISMDTALTAIELCGANEIQRLKIIAYDRTPEGLNSLNSAEVRDAAEHKLKMLLKFV